MIAVAVLVLSAAGIWIYVANIDWNKHKDKISAQLFELTGKKVVFSGPVGLSILPSPTLTASDVKIYNENGTYKDKPLAEIKSLVAKVSLKSVLSEEWDVSRLSVVEPEIVFDIAEDGRLNWQSENKKFQHEGAPLLTISLNSATLEKAKVHLIDAKNNIDATLDNLNAEIIAESIFGPYRIEGSYLRDRKPEGFAVSLGRFTKNFATTVNMVINYPSTESYVRFDGSVFLENRSVNGNVIFESQKIASFLNEMTPLKNVDLAYNQPLVVTAALKKDQSRLDFSNVVVKYGATTGAGNVLLPLAETERQEKIEMAFNMTFLDVQPVERFLKQLFDGVRKDGTRYFQNSDIDFICDITALKASYNNEELRNLSLSFDWTGRKFLLRELKGEMMADTMFEANGSADVAGETPSYDFDVSFQTGEFAKLSSWAGYPLKQVAPATYQKAKGTARLQGNQENMQIAPFELAIDNSLLKGEAGIIWGDKIKSMLVLNADSINFDNYVEKLPEIDADKRMVEKIAARFKQLDFLGGLDTRVILNLGLGIYGGVPYENVVSEFVLADNVLTIGKLDIGNAADSKVQLSGRIGGFGQEPVFQNFRYHIDTDNASALMAALGVDKEKNAAPALLKKFSIQGEASGDVRQADVKIESKLENLTANYQGKVDYSGSSVNFNGDLELKNPDFVRFVNNLGYAYKPKAFSLGLLQFKSKVSGSPDNFSLTDADLNIGSNNFKGSFVFDRSNGRPRIQTTMHVSRFEIERFVQEEKASAVQNNFKETVSSFADFLPKPVLSQDKFDYAPLNEIDLNGSFVFDSLSCRSEKMTDVSFDATMQNGMVNVANFKAAYKGGMLTGNLELAAGAEPHVNAKLQLKDMDAAGFALSGNLYGLSGGKLGGAADLNASAESFADMVKSLSGTVRLSVALPVVKGWNLEAIANDLKKRENSSGLAELIRDNMQKGSTSFDVFSADLALNNGQYKLENASFSSQTAIVSVAASGSVSEWTVDGMFSVRWNGEKAMPGFNFMMAGTLDTPQISVNSDDLVRLFDERVARQEAEKKAREQEREKMLKDNMDVQQNRAKQLKQELEGKTAENLKKQSEAAYGEKARERLAALEVGRVENIKQLEKAFTLGMTPEFDEALVQTVREINDSVEQKLEKFLEEMAAVYHDDLTEKVDSYYQKIKDKTQEAETLNNECGVRLKAFQQRLIRVDSPLILETQDDVKNIKNTADSAFVAVKGAEFDATKDYGVVKTENTVPGLENFAAVLEEKYAAAQKAFDDMKAAVENLSELCENKVSAEEEKDRQRREAEAIKKKVEENTSTISVSGSGKVMRVVPDIEDVQRAEEAVRNEEVRVLDFSGKNSVQGVVRQDNAPQNISEKKQNSGFVIKDSDGSAKTGGTVVRQ